MPTSSISTLGATTSPRPASWRWVITTARRGCRGISNRGSQPFGAKLSQPGAPYREYNTSVKLTLVDARPAESSVATTSGSFALRSADAPPAGDVLRWTLPYRPADTCTACSFAADSPVEGDGFELTVPLTEVSSCRAMRAERLGDSPALSFEPAAGERGTGTECGEFADRQRPLHRRHAAI